MYNVDRYIRGREIPVRIFVLTFFIYMYRCHFFSNILLFKNMYTESTEFFSHIHCSLKLTSSLHYFFFLNIDCYHTFVCHPWIVIFSVYQRNYQPLWVSLIIDNFFKVFCSSWCICMFKYIFHWINIHAIYSANHFCIQDTEVHINADFSKTNLSKVLI